MGQKVEVSGTGYDIKAGKCFVGGTAYAIKKGRTLIGGTGYDISLVSGVPIDELTPGTSIYITENNVATQFYIAKHDYESGLNGMGRTLLIRAHIVKNDVFGNNQLYNNSILDKYFNETYPSLFSGFVQSLMSNTSFPWRPGLYAQETIYTKKAFALSITEYGLSGSYMPVEGTSLPIRGLFNAIALEANEYRLWSRTMNLETSSTMTVSILESYNGEIRANSYYCYASYGYLPAFSLPGEALVSDNGDGTYTLVEE